MTSEFECEECKKVFGRNEYLKVHLRIHNNLRPFVCESCPSTFKDPSAFGRHKKFHLENRKTYSCDECNKVFKTNSAIYSHKLNHSNERKFSCSQCSQCTFKTKRRLTDHEYISLGNHAFECDLCGKKFACQQYLDTHKRWHNNLTSEICTVCSKTFKNKAYLTKHIKTHKGKKNHTNEKSVIRGLRKIKVLRNIHQFMMMTIDNTPVDCLVCSKSFRNKFRPTNYSIVHVTENSQCNEYDKAFKNKLGLKEHKKRAHSVKEARVTFATRARQNWQI